MANRDGDEKRDVGNWIRFLESQVASRNSEIGLLRSEVQEKSKIIERLQAGHEQDTSRLAEMTDALVIASSAIRELESQISSLREVESRLSHEVDVARSELQKVQQQTQDSKSGTSIRRSSMSLGIGIFVIGLLSGFSYRMFSSDPDVLRASSEEFSSDVGPKQAGETAVVEIPESKEKSTEMALSAKPLQEENLMKESLGKRKEPSNADAAHASPSPASVGKLTSGAPGELASREDWMSVLSDIRHLAFKVEKSESWSVSRDYRAGGFPVVITRDQFRDVVSKTLPTALPSRGLDGLVLFEFDAAEIDREHFVKHLKTDGIASASVCKPGSLDPARFRRLSIVVSSQSSALECLKNLLVSQWFKHDWEEISVVSLASKARFSASFYSDKKFVSFQEWEPDWITAVTVGDEADARVLPVFRARRLASIARVLSKSSDVHVEVPVSERGYVSFGNFAVVPSGLVKGAVRATRISASSGLAVGKTVSQQVVANAKAVIINGAEIKPEKRDRY